MSGIEKSKTVLKEMAPYTADLLNPFALSQTLIPLQVIKSIVLSVLLPVRLVLMFLILIIAWIVGVITLQGITKEQALGLKPFSGWRRRWAKPFIVSLARLIFFVGGWYWIPQRGRRACSREAPILLAAPHSSFFDTVLVIALGCPSLVAKDSLEKTPLFGRLVRYMQPFYVREGDPDSRHRIVDEIRARVTSGEDFEQLLIFPEGGCGNRRALLQFKLGGFSPGVPVQPVFIRYKNNLDSITWSWEGPGAWKQLWLTLTQFCIKCELEFLPVYNPSRNEKEDPRLFANNVQAYMSRWSGIPSSRFSLEDARFLRGARSRHLPLTAALVKLMKLRRTLGRQNISPADELTYLAQKRFTLDGLQGDVKVMAKYLELDRCPEALKDYFQLIDQHDSNCVDVRVYDAGVCLLQDDFTVKQKLNAAFKIFGKESTMEPLEAILLYWRGVPCSLTVLKAINILEKPEGELSDY